MRSKAFALLSGVLVPIGVVSVACNEDDPPDRTESVSPPTIPSSSDPPSADAAASTPDSGSDSGSVPTTPTPTNPVPVGVDGGWTLVFDDEFDGASLDTTKWDPYWYDEGGKMNEVGTYASNVAVSEGHLILTLASATSGASVNTQSNKGFAVKVGMYAEARVYFPGNGTKLYNWPAWWISGTPWPTAGEHDVAEVLNDGDLTINYHSPSGAHNKGTVSGYWGDAFHVYGIHRKADSADVYWDGKQVESYATDDNGDGQNLIFNLGSGGGVSAYGAASQVKVDYVRVWK